jgi:hypothetical protein
LDIPASTIRDSAYSTLRTTVSQRSHYGLSANPLEVAHAALDEAHEAMGRLLAAASVELFESDARHLIGCCVEVVLLVQTVGHDESLRLGRAMETEEVPRRMWFDSWFAFEVRAIIGNAVTRAWESGDRDAFGIVPLPSSAVEQQRRETGSSPLAVDELRFQIDDTRAALDVCTEYLRIVTSFYDAAVEEVARLRL